MTYLQFMEEFTYTNPRAVLPKYALKEENKEPKETTLLGVGGQYMFYKKNTPIVARHARYDPIGHGLE